MSKIFFKIESNNPWIQFVRYTFTGGLAFAVDFGLLILLVELFKQNVFVASTISFICGMAVSYLACIRWVFDHRNLPNQWLELLIFCFIGSIGLGFNILLIWALTHYTQLHYPFAKLIAACFVCLWNFTSKKLFLFY